MSIRGKLIVAIFASMVALAVATGALVRSAGERNVRRAAELAISSAGEALAAMERADVEKLDATLSVLAAHPGLAEAFAARDRPRLLALAAPIFATLKAEHDITHFYFLEPEPSRACFLRVHRPEQFGDVVTRATLTLAIDSRGLGSGKELGQTAFALRVVRPWYGRDGGAPLGYLELGEEIDHFLGRMKAQTRDEYGLLVAKSFLDEQAWAATRQGLRNNWGDRARTVVVDTTTADEAIIDFDGDLSSIPEHGLLLEQDARDGRIFVRGIVPVKDAAGRRVGGLFVRHDITALHASMLEARRGIYLVLLAVAAVLAGLLVWLVNGLVFRRLDGMVATMDGLSSGLAGGDFDVGAPRATADDEIGRFEAHLGRFLQVVAGVLKQRGRKGTG
ncbi:MAG TPA: cache domain-containing protein [Anaeromyxobacter sp.]